MTTSTSNDHPTWSVEILHKDNGNETIYCYSYDEASTEGILSGRPYIITKIHVVEGAKEYVKGEN